MSLKVPRWLCDVTLMLKEQGIKSIIIDHPGATSGCTQCLHLTVAMEVHSSAVCQPHGGATGKVSRSPKSESVQNVTHSAADIPAAIKSR